MSDKWGPWIVHNGTSCPYPGQYAQVHYGDGDIEEGIAQNHINWYYAHAYRVRREVERDGDKVYSGGEMEVTH